MKCFLFYKKINKGAIKVVNLTEKEFGEKKSLKVIFPMYIKINGDELTPVNIFYKLKGQYKFL